MWEASGHLANFTDPLVDCTNCKQRFRLDQLDDPDTCPNCGAHGTFTEARAFNLMFKTHAGPVEGAGADVYLRPETAQGMFVNFANVLQTDAQEAAVRHRPGRQELPQRDHPAATSSSAPASSSRWRWSSSSRRPTARSGTSTGATSGCNWYVDLGIPAEHAAPARRTTPTSSATTPPAPPTSSSCSRGAGASSRASPSAPTTTSPSTPRTPASSSTTSTRPTNERYVPYVIEPAAGVTRTMAAFLLAAYDEDVVNDEARTVLRLHPRLAPYKVAVLPLSKKDTLTPLAQQVRAHARPSGTWSTTTRRRRSAGATAARTRSAPRLCVTVDFDSLDDNAVTIRDRDTTEQVRVPIESLVDEVRLAPRFLSRIGVTNARRSISSTNELIRGKLVACQRCRRPHAAMRRSLELANALRPTITRLARRLRQQDHTGLGPTMTAALASIAKHGGPTHGELAAIEQVAPPTITAVVGKMEKSRSGHARDRHRRSPGHSHSDHAGRHRPARRGAQPAHVVARVPVDRADRRRATAAGRRSRRPGQARRRCRGVQLMADR